MTRNAHHFLYHTTFIAPVKQILYPASPSLIGVFCSVLSVSIPLKTDEIAFGFLRFYDDSFASFISFRESMITLTEDTSIKRAILAPMIRSGH